MKEKELAFDREKHLPYSKTVKNVMLKHLTAASYFEDITLTIGITPSDFIWQGFMQGRRDGCKEWSIEGESLFSYKGSLLPYMPFAYRHPEYWRLQIWKIPPLRLLQGEIQYLEKEAAN